MKKRIALLLSAIMSLSAFGGVGAYAEEEDVTTSLPRAINNVIKVEAEDYVSTTGSNGDVYVDSNSALKPEVVAFRNEVVMTYKVYIRYGANYKFSAVSAQESEASIIFKQQDSPYEAIVTAPSTHSLSSYEKNTIPGEYYIPAGVATIEVRMSGLAHFDYFTMEQGTTPKANTLELENPDWWEFYDGAGNKQTGDPFFNADGSATEQGFYRAYGNPLASGGYTAGFNGAVAEYVFNIEEAGLYTFTLAYEVDGAIKANVTIDNVPVTSNKALPSTGRWNPDEENPSFSTAVIAENIPLDKGTHFIKFNLDGGMTGDCITYAKTGEITNRGKIVRRAESFDLLAGHGTGFYDNDSGKLSNDTYDKKYNPVEVGGVSGVRFAVGMEPNEWLKYNVYAENEGFYRFDVEAARPFDVEAEIQVNGNKLVYSDTAYAENAWTTFETVPVGTVYLNEGDNTVIVKNTGNPMNFGGFSLTPAGFELYNADGDRISQTVTGKMKASIKLNNLYNGVKPTLIAALYSGGNMDSVKFCQCDDEGKAEVELDGVESQTLKMFLWDNLSGLTPLLQSEESEARSNEEINTITCWGDSLTAGAGGNGTSYPGVLGDLLADRNVSVYNMGVGGETAYTIAGRQGAIPMEVNAFTIPADTTKTEITFANANTVQPLLQGGSNSINPCYINGVEGTITYEGPQGVYTWVEGESKYYFTRSAAGNETPVEQGTKVTTNAMNSRRGDTAVIFVGQNGPADIDELISIQKEMIAYNGSDNYLIVGLTTGNVNYRSAMEAAMKNTYGAKYLNLREYMSSAEAFEDANLTPSQEDLNSMMNGSVPAIFLSDTVHFNAAGYKLIGNKIYEKLIELGYIR